MKFKKFLSVALGLVMGLSLAVSCAPGKEDGGGEQGDSTENIVFSDVWTAGISQNFTSGDSYTLDVGADIGSQNYIRLNYSAACGLDAVMYFTDSDGAQEYSERFYLSPEDTEFRQILNYYHENNYEKRLDRIEFKCVYGNGVFALEKISVATHPIDFSKVNFYMADMTEENMRLYIEGNTVKLGVNLKLGGAIDHLSSVNQGVSLSAELGKLYVGQNAKERVYQEDDVNLINAHDTGRLIQQSFYGTLGDSAANPQDDYICGYFNHDGNSATPDIAWPYNPVQGGDQYQNLSQLVDVQYSEDEIYVKTRPMDWAKNNSVTPFYMENTYRVIDDPVYGEYVQVTNRSTDFSGYVHNNPRDQELPAFYGITPLGRLATYKGTSPWTGGIVSTEENLGFWSPSTAENRFEATENWIAWLNEDDWGIGLYVPDVTSMLAGRNEYSVDTGVVGIFPDEAVQCTYTAPLGVFSMPSYESFSYSYYLKLDYLIYSRALFASLHEAGASNGDLLRLEGRKA